MDDAAPVAQGDAHRLGPLVREPGQDSANELAVFCGGEGSKCVADLFHGSVGGFAHDAIFGPDGSATNLKIGSLSPRSNESDVAPSAHSLPFLQMSINCIKIMMKARSVAFANPTHRGNDFINLGYVSTSGPDYATGSGAPVWFGL